MKIAFDKKTVSLSVGEFAAFSNAPETARQSRAGGLWRAQVGTAWHGELRRRSEQESGECRFEIPISGRWPCRGWTIELQGRADQVLIRGDHVLLREVKTVSDSLPVSEPELRRHYPAYFRQIAAYRALYPFSAPEGTPSDTPEAELLFLEINTGLTQCVRLDTEDDAAFRDQVERLVEFLQQRGDHLRRLRDCRIRSPFETPRPGQDTISGELERAVAKYPVILFEAPTGFGKTAYLLERALNELKDGRVTRILYLTGKATGQLQVHRELRSMLAEDTPVSRVQVRNKRDHCINTVFHCFRETCPFLEDLEERWEKSALRAGGLIERTEFDLDTVRAAGRESGICPYEITRATLPAADIWIGDYNYVFSPANRSFFHERPGFDPAQTLLIVDEAHNLPARVADNHSVRFGTAEARDVLTDFTFQDASSGLRRSWEDFLDFIAALRPCDRCAPADEEHLAATTRNVVEHLQATPPDYAGLAPETLRHLDAVIALHRFLEEVEIDKLLWVPKSGVLAGSCLDASVPLAKTLRAYRTAILASATFGPETAFLKQCGLDHEPERAVQITAAAPWREGAYNIAIDLRPDTRYRQRERHMEGMAGTIARICEHSARPAVVFFPSYRFARGVQQTLAEHFPGLRVAVQEQRQGLEEQTAFIEESLLLCDVLFLILGSSYAESIDLLGGRIDYAVVAGPALPEVNPVQNARMETGSAVESRDERFHRVYQIPGMQKVNQALGRLVRAPGQRTRVLLLCRRFADPAYRGLLAPDLEAGTLIIDDSDLASWLELD